MELLIEYDKYNPISIETYSKKLIGMSFKEVVEADNNSTKENKSNKGDLGQLIEEYFFHYKCNSKSEPDIKEAGVEIKVSPYKIKKNGELAAKERLVLTMIDYFEVVKEKTLEESHLWYKCRLMLIIYYLYKDSIRNRLDYRINFSKLFTPPEQDLLIIKDDYNFIVNKIRSGLAHELSEGDTLYLGACTKASKSTDRRKQPFSDIEAKPRAFSFKTSYMSYILNHYIRNDKTTYDPIVKESINTSFEDFVVQKIGQYSGYNINELSKIFNIGQEEFSKSKNILSLLTYKILGVKSNKAEEFEKAGIQVKTIRIHGDKIKESMSFPNFKFLELIEEEWDNSTFGNYLRETKFLLVVYKFDSNNNCTLQGCQFWNIPYNDLENEVRIVWERTKETIVKGIEVKKIGNRTINNLPKKTESRVSHVRPHAKNKFDTYELPDGSQFPKQCFWLNNDYIYSQLNDKLK